MDGIRAELSDAGYPDLPLGGSSEENMTTGMTALGITLLGECDTPAWRLARPGDGIYLVGTPRMGAEVLAHADEVMSAQRLRRLRARPEVGEILPCGSRGAAWELQVLAREIGLRVQLHPEISPLLFTHSAGPATCAIITASAPFSFDGMPVVRLGEVTN